VPRLVIDPRDRFHGLPSETDPTALPERRSVDLTDLLAARGGAHLLEALRGEPEAMRAFEQETDRILETEDIQLE
jgi:hypothetical protein